MQATQTPVYRTRRQLLARTGAGGTALLMAVAACQLAPARREPLTSKHYRIEHWDYPEGPLDAVETNIRETIARFQQEHPNVTIELTMLNFTDGPAKFETALASGTPPDVYHFGGSSRDVQTGLLVDLTPFYTRQDREDIYPEVLDFVEYQGKYWRWPTYTTIWCMNANRKLVEEAGVDWRAVQRDGWTTDEFVEAMRRATTSQRWGYTWAEQEQWSFMSRNWGLVYRISPQGEWIFRGEPAIQSIQWLIDTFDKFKISPPETPRWSRTEAGALYNRQEAAVLGRGGLGAIANSLQGRTPFEQVLLPWPHHRSAKEVNHGGVYGKTVWRQQNYKGDDHTQIAVKYAKVRSIDEMIFESELIAVLPNRKSGDEAVVKAGRHALLQADGGVHYQFAQRYRKLMTGWWPPKLEPRLVEKTAQIQRDAWNPIFLDIIQGRTSPREGVAELEARARGILAAP
jgi:multiple sugar transport system substrate-binding protein